MNKKIIKKELSKYISEDGVRYSVDANNQQAVDSAKEEAKNDGVDSTIELTTENDGDDDELNGLIPDEEKSERGFEYGVNTNENFDKLMEELKESGSPTIKLAESVNPRIKVKDLIKHLKNKK